MSTPPLPSPEPRKPISLAKLATLFAVTFGIAFGLCAITALGVGGNVNKYGIAAAAIVEAICLLGLIVVAILAIARSARR
jgi:hypothetical protein